MAKTYDPACYELAEHFLRDEPISGYSTPYEQACRDLALHIQQAVEDWFIAPDAAALGPRDKDAQIIAGQALRIEALEAALQFIVDGCDNQDINHVDYRVRVYQVARAALDKDANK